ncbi:MAG: YitT family protein [Oscillospiraceae bacterium]|nr:YitT family protein [Oscillospiraceae bacterium]
MKTVFKKILEYISIIGLALISALSYVMFVFPNDFAPAGFNGIATIIQYVFDINAGYLVFLINIPIIILVFIFVDKEFAVKTLVFIICFSGGLAILDQFDLSAFIYQTDNGTSTILGPVVAGFISGATVGAAFLLNSCSGGTELVSALIHKYRPGYNFVWIAFILNVIVAIISYFVYGYKIEPVILCILFSYFSSAVSDKILRGNREAVKFEVITDHPEEVGKAIIERLGHSATIIRGEGAYTKSQKNMLFCIINKYEIVQFKEILDEYPDTFAVVSNVNDTIGKFVNHRQKKSAVS